MISLATLTWAFVPAALVGCCSHLSIFGENPPPVCPVLCSVAETRHPPPRDVRIPQAETNGANRGKDAPPARTYGWGVAATGSASPGRGGGGGSGSAAASRGCRTATDRRPPDRHRRSSS